MSSSSWKDELFLLLAVDLIEWLGVAERSRCFSIVVGIENVASLLFVIERAGASWRFSGTSIEVGLGDTVLSLCTYVAECTDVAEALKERGGVAFCSEFLSNGMGETFSLLGEYFTEWTGEPKLSFGFSVAKSGNIIVCLGVLLAE